MVITVVFDVWCFGSWTMPQPRDEREGRAQRATRHRRGAGGVPAEAPRGFGAQPRVEEAEKGAHSAPRGTGVGRVGSPRRRRGGSGRSPELRKRNT